MALSIKSSKSAREVKLESKITRLETLVGSQMEVIANLQKTMEALNAKLKKENDGSDTLVTTNSYHKRAKTGQSPRKKGHTSDSNSDQDMLKITDGHNDNDVPRNSPAITAADLLMGTNNNDLNGRINDDDITGTLLQHPNIADTPDPSSKPLHLMADEDHDL